MLYPDKDWSYVKKFHNMLEHVHSIGAVVGGWELVSTNVFEIMNKIEKHIALHRTNKKGIDEQVLLSFWFLTN